MQIKLGEAVDGRVDFTGSFTEEELNFLGNLGLAKVLQYGVAAVIMENEMELGAMDPPDTLQ